ncbi:hypothetical protein D3C80_1253990 [compost metagenome]
MGDAELPGAGDADRGAPGLEGAGGDDALILHPEIRNADLLAQSRQGQQRGEAFPQGDHLGGIAHRQQLVITPQAGGATQQGGRVPGLLQGLEIVAGQERRPRPAQLLGLVGIMGLARLAATQM